MGAHVEHESTSDEVEYVPTAQGVHVVAPALVPVSVMDPAPQVEHESTSDEVEYVPAGQGVHDVAPIFVPVFVMYPAPHETHTLLFK